MAVHTRVKKRPPTIFLLISAGVCAVLLGLVIQRLMLRDTDSRSPVSSTSECLKIARGTNESEICNARELEAKRKELSEVLQYVRSPEANTEPEALDFLSRAERHWHMFYDQDCKAEAASYGAGTYATTAQLLCLTERFDQRIQQLKAWNPGHWSR